MNELLPTTDISDDLLNFYPFIVLGFNVSLSKKKKFNNSHTNRISRTKEILPNYLQTPKQRKVECLPETNCFIYY